MQPLAGPTLLALWERGLSRHALDRSALLAAAARPDWPADTVVDRPLGAVNASLLRLRAASFGPRIDGHVDCPGCGQRLAFALDTQVLLDGADQDMAAETEVAGLRLRPPSLRDLAAVAAEADAAHGARALLARCTLAGDAARLDEEALARAEAALEQLDPQADLALALQCTDCGHAGNAQLDPGSLLWDELEVRAHALLAEVHRLACAYGWTEEQVLALGPARRACYLAMVAI
ncbi:hypothetical protein [Pseudorhodoferax sp.]|uniref:hypothetical protein n=1 Tax=Pseudorhodoferax sp. TaxID=1993553 RepID=UPI002DD6AD01|nr:hypothetical protein [Pseudorhodoferax sp.]